MIRRPRVWLPALLAAWVWLGCSPPTGDDDSSAGGADDLGMVEIPGGSFQLGAVDHDPNALSVELPRHEVTLSPFLLDLHEVTVEAYGQAVEAGVVEEPSCRLEYEDQEEFCNWGKEDRMDHPVNGVDWFDAREYCGWLGKRLPTEAELEYVLRAERTNAVYPWGDELVPPDDYGNLLGEETKDADTGWEYIQGYRDPFVGSAPVGSFAVDAFGLYDVSGNVWEWAEDWVDEAGYPDGQDVDPPGVADGERKILRGGGFHCVREELRCSERHNKQPDDRVVFTGFRCASDG